MDMPRRNSWQLMVEFRWNLVFFFLDMYQKWFFVFYVTLAVSYGFPTDTFVKSVAESNNFDDFDNYIPRYDDIPKHNHPSLNHIGNESHINFNSSEEVPLFFQDESTPSFTIEVVTTSQGLPNIELIDKEVPGLDHTIFQQIDDVLSTTTNSPSSTTVVTTEPTTSLAPTVVDVTKSTESNPTTELKTTELSTTGLDNTDLKPPKVNPTVIKPTEITTEYIKITTKETPSTKTPETPLINNSFNISDVDSPINETTRNPREEGEKDDPEFAEKESDEEGSSEEEEDMNMVTGILSALLGGLSKPDGSIDLDAIVGLVGSLSTQNEDGTYDFQGITDLLKGFFGGGGDGGGGSDIGAFTGGLLGAVIKGIANPPGGKGVGILLAKILGGILPALSVQPPEDGKPSLVKPGGLDIGGFLSGFLKTVFGASKGINPVKVVISTITSLSNSKPPHPPKGKGNSDR
ncbi:unnamed protein product [Phyllotreta striolata]|uniref:Uncharacterized protein n=1 Tax=Phyllotreta striolata TaxID=444603 RepID=A0A9N9TW16_PHYSR|nr:unnamed protein product [Phyllotreta striolata]